MQMTADLRELQAERRRKWVAALRSGEYKQTKGLLRTRSLRTHEDAYCCLGVACEVARLEGLDVTWEVSSDLGSDHIESLGVVAPTSHPDSEYPTYIEGGVLPAFVAEWYGINDQHGGLTSVVYDGDFEASTLVDLNDGGRNFNKIADAIESSLDVG
jgi:hypothetical protein